MRGVRVPLPTPKSPAGRPGNKVSNAVHLHAHDREGKARFRFKPLSEIIRDARGKKIGRIISRRPHKIDAWGVGTFRSIREAVAAIRSKHEARR